MIGKGVGEEDSICDVEEEEVEVEIHNILVRLFIPVAMGLLIHHNPS
jgi:hypothetical protein